MIDKILTALVCALVALLIVAWIRSRRADKKRQRDLWEELERTPESKTVHGTVVHLGCFAETVGTKSPTVVKHFFVDFRDDGGEILRVAVEEEIYAAFEVGQVGTLTLLLGRVGGFSLDE